MPLEWGIFLAPELVVSIYSSFYIQTRAFLVSM
jgi:hypothetical protein